MSGRGFTPTVQLLVNGVAFKGAASVGAGGTSIKQKGKLADGRTIVKAIKKGQTVSLTVRNSTGAEAVFQYTR
jgi:hypothetical protein